MAYFHVLLRRIGRAFHFKRHWHTTRENHEHNHAEQANVMLSLHALAQQAGQVTKLKQALTHLCKQPEKTEKIHVYYSIEMPAQLYAQAKASEETQQLFADLPRQLAKLEPKHISSSANLNGNTKSMNFDKAQSPELILPPAYCNNNYKRPIQNQYQLLTLYKVGDRGRLQISNTALHQQHIHWCHPIEATEYRPLSLTDLELNPKVLRQHPEHAHNNPIVHFFQHVLGYLHHQDQHLHRNDSPPTRSLKKSLRHMKHHHSCFRKFRRQRSAEQLTTLTQSQTAGTDQTASSTDTTPENPGQIAAQQQQKRAADYFHHLPDHVLSTVVETCAHLNQSLSPPFKGERLLSHLNKLFKIAQQVKTERLLSQGSTSNAEAYQELLGAHFGKLDDDTLLSLHQSLGEQAPYELYYTAFNLTETPASQPFGIEEHKRYDTQAYQRCLAYFCRLMMSFVEQLEHCLKAREHFNRYDMNEQRLSASETQQINKLLKHETLVALHHFVQSQLGPPPLAIINESIKNQSDDAIDQDAFYQNALLHSEGHHQTLPNHESF